MLRRRSLRRVLAAQWIGFTLALAALFVVLTVLLLYVLEDSFIDRRLRDTAARIERLDELPALPDRYSVHPEARLPAELRVRLRDASIGAIREFRRGDGRYVHVLWTRTADGTAYALVYDATDDLTVNAGIARAWPYLLPLFALLALAAYALARRFTGRVARKASHLLEQLRSAPDPAALRHYADAEAIREFSELARLSADAWDARLAALERERTTLAFLAHELRTPLQSARTSLALLEDDRGNVAAFARLQRALARLTRASNSLLWLASGAAPAAGETTAMAELLGELVAEFQPLAAAREQRFALHVAEGSLWPLRRDAAETLFANLLLNAVQHGSAGVVRIEIEADAVQIHNPCAEPGEGGGFGLGLQIVQRLAERCGLRLRIDSDVGGRTVRVERDAGALSQVAPGDAAKRAAIQRG